MEQPAAFCWSTDEAGQKERFDYWREAICAAFDPMSPELEKCDRDTFRGTVSAWRLGDAALMEIRASAHRTGRAPQDITRGSGDYLFLYRQRAKAWFGFDYQDDFVAEQGALCFGDADRCNRRSNAVVGKLGCVARRSDRRVKEVQVGPMGTIAQKVPIANRPSE